MAAKQNAIRKTLRKAQSVLASYTKPGRRSAEKSLDELLRVLNDTRVTLMRAAKKTIGTARKPRRRKRAGTKRRMAAKAAGPRRSAAAARRSAIRKSAARKGARKRAASRR